MMSSTVLDKASARRAPTVTRAPRAARKAAKNLPRPLEPPVTSTCDPSIPNRSLIANLLAKFLRPKIAPSLNPGPDQNGPAHGAIQIALVRGGRDRQRIALQHEMPDLIGAGPRLVPRCVDVMNHHIVPERERAGIGDHGAKQFHTFFVGGNHITRG